jgi:sulfate adenylyltransferase (ADP) / ATP adenylyltransferase
VLGHDGKKFDPFAPPYIPNLHLGDLKDEVEGDEYVVLVSKSCSYQHVPLDWTLFLVQ